MSRDLSTQRRQLSHATIWERSDSNRKNSNCKTLGQKWAWQGEEQEGVSNGAWKEASSEKEKLYLINMPYLFLFFFFSFLSHIAFSIQSFYTEWYSVVIQYSHLGVSKVWIWIEFHFLTCLMTLSSLQSLRLGICLINVFTLQLKTIY